MLRTCAKGKATRIHNASSELVQCMRNMQEFTEYFNSIITEDILDGHRICMNVKRWIRQEYDSSHRDAEYFCEILLKYGERWWI